MEEKLLVLYQIYFIDNTNAKQYLHKISLDIASEFSVKEISFFIKSVDEHLDLIALEYLLRKKKKDNIFSFVFLRLSSLAESTPENQNLYVNKFNANIFRVFIFLISTVWHTMILELKRITLSKKIKEYFNV